MGSGQAFGWQRSSPPFLPSLCGYFPHYHPSAGAPLLENRHFGLPGTVWSCLPEPVRLLEPHPPESHPSGFCT